MAMSSNIVMNNTPAPGAVNSGATYNPNYKIDYTGSGLNPTNTSVGKSATTGVSPKGGIASPYAVVTSAPATNNLNNITTDYNTNIKPAVDNAANEKAATTAANSQLPVISGYNVSPSPTGNQGEEKATNANGQSYYITPQQTGSNTDALKSILSSPEGVPPSGTPTPTSTTAPATPAQTAQTSTGINPSTENTNYQGQVQGVTDQLTTAYNQFNQVIQTVQTGSFPLTGPQQSLVDATNAAFKQMSDQANLKAAALSSETGGVSNKITAMAGQLTNITSQQAAAIAKLEIGFQETDYKLITDSYTQFKDLEKQKMTAIKDAHDAVMSTYNSALTASQKQQELELQQKTQAETERHQKEQDILSAQGTYSVVTNPDGTQSIFNNKSGKVVGSPNNGVNGDSVLNGTVEPGKTGVPILDTNTKYSTQGVPYVDGSNLTGKQADAAQLRAAKLGLPYMGKTQASQLSKIEDGKSNLDAVNASIMAYLPKDATGRLVAGPENKLSQYLQTNDQLAAFGTWRTAAIGILQALAGGQGSGLRINQAEIKMSLENDIPNITDTVGTAQQKMKNITTLLNNSERSIFGGNIYDKFNPNTPTHQAASALDNMFGIGNAGSTTSDSTVSSAFSNIGI